MIIHALCNSCFSRFEIRTDHVNLHLVKQLSDEHNLCPCPRLCGGKINLKNPSDDAFKAMVEHPALRDPITITAQELYKAVNGFGLPDEIPTSAEVVEALLKSSPVVEVKLDTAGRAVHLDYLTLQNGTQVHFCAGPLGAKVMKITKKREG